MKDFFEVPEPRSQGCIIGSFSCHVFWPEWHSKWCGMAPQL